MLPDLAAPLGKNAANVVSMGDFSGERRGRKRPVMKPIFYGKPFFTVTRFDGKGMSRDFTGNHFYGKPFSP